MTDLALKLIRTIPRVRQVLVMRLRQRGVRHSIPQLQVLALVEASPRTVSELAEVQGVTKATMSVTLARMANQGLVSRKHALDDQRQVIVGPTAKGRAASERAQDVAEAILDEMVARLSREEKELLTSGVELLMSAVERVPADRPSK